MIIERKLNTFCETPGENCTMNYCDENGCQNRKRELADIEVEASVVVPKEEPKQETLEEFAEKVSRAFDNDNYKSLMQLVEDGAEWQQEQIYNQIKELYDNENITGFSKRAYAQCLDIIEQFKNK
jgi:uncharacterized protein (UPF0335 family)